MIFILKHNDKNIYEIYSLDNLSLSEFNIDLFDSNSYNTGIDQKYWRYKGGISLSSDNQTIVVQSRIRVGTKEDIYPTNYYQFEFDYASNIHERKKIYFCCTNNEYDSSVDWYNVLGNGYVEIGYDVGSTAYISVVKNGQTVFNKSFSSSIFEDFENPSSFKHLVFRRFGDKASLSINGLVLADDLDVSGLENKFGVWKWNDNTTENVTFKNPQIKRFKQIHSITTTNGDIIYQLKQPSVEFTFTGTTLTQHSSGSFSGTDMFIDYGDGTIETTTGRFGHTYSEEGTYTVKMYGVTSLGGNCFRICTGLTSIIISDSVTSLGTSCFEGCTGLTSIDIPNSVTSIGSICFYGCTGLTSITIPDSITSLGTSCFYNCTSLTSITIPNNVTRLGLGCFHSCTGLTSIDIPNSVTSIETGCFNGCTNLTSITIPNSVTNIGGNCFYGCTILTNIILNWTTSNTVLQYNSNWIKNANANLKFEIPEYTSSLYIEKGYPTDKLVEY